VEFTIVPFTGDSGQMAGIAAIMRDTTARFEELRALRPSARRPPGRKSRSVIAPASRSPLTGSQADPAVQEQISIVSDRRIGIASSPRLGKGTPRREEPLQSPDAAQFLDLLGDPRFKATVKCRHLIGALPLFAEQTRVRATAVPMEFFNNIAPFPVIAGARAHKVGS
jgi:hypothetical protein